VLVSSGANCDEGLVRSSVSLSGDAGDGVAEAMVRDPLPAAKGRAVGLGARVGDGMLVATETCGALTHRAPDLRTAYSLRTFLATSPLKKDPRSPAWLASKNPADSTSASAIRTQCQGLGFGIFIPLFSGFARYWRLQTKSKSWFKLKTGFLKNT
jgi:hypothetical protein